MSIFSIEQYYLNEKGNLRHPEITWTSYPKIKHCETFILRISNFMHPVSKIHHHFEGKKPLSPKAFRETLKKLKDSYISLLKEVHIYIQNKPIYKGIYIREKLFSSDNVFKSSKNNPVFHSILETFSKNVIDLCIEAKKRKENHFTEFYTNFLDNLKLLTEFWGLFEMNKKRRSLRKHLKILLNIQNSDFQYIGSKVSMEINKQVQTIIKEHGPTNGLNNVEDLKIELGLKNSSFLEAANHGKVKLDLLSNEPFNPKNICELEKDYFGDILFSYNARPAYNYRTFYYLVKHRLFHLLSRNVSKFLQKKNNSTTQLNFCPKIKFKTTKKYKLSQYKLQPIPR